HPFYTLSLHDALPISVASGGQLAAERRVLTDREALEEALFTGLRLTRGIDVHTVNARYTTDVWGIYGDGLERFREAGLLIYDGRSEEHTSELQSLAYL